MIFYQKTKYSTYCNKKNKSIIQKVEMLSEEFDKQFNEAVEVAFTDTSKFLEKIRKKYRNIVEYYFWQAKKKIYDDSICIKPHKYFYKDTVMENRYGVNDGYLSFSPPEYFNDPFDCNCLLSNNIDMRDKFRVLCLTHQYDNILMWSYYSQSHKGYCFQFSYNDLIDKIKKIKVSGLCIYGGVNYNKKRPPQKSKVNYFSFTDLKFYINATFTKYLEWRHEKEYRFVIISQNFIKENDESEVKKADIEEKNGKFVTIKADIKKIYEGCLGDGKSIYNSQNVILNTVRLSKDDVKYKLI